MIEALLMLADNELGRLIRSVLTGSQDELPGKERLLRPIIKRILITPFGEETVVLSPWGETFVQDEI